MGIHKRRRQFEGGKWSKFIEISQQTEIKKNLHMGEVGVKKFMVATDELLCLKNAGTQISIFFTSNEYSAPITIEKNQNPGGHFGATS